MLTRTMRHVRLTGPSKGQVLLWRAPLDLQPRLREYCLSAPVKKQLKTEMEKNGALGGSFEELEKTQEKSKKAKPTTRGASTNHLSANPDKKASQDSLKPQVHNEKTVPEKDAKAKFHENAANFNAKKCDTNMGSSENVEQIGDVLDGAREFVRRYIAGLNFKEIKLIHPSRWPELRDEWKEAAQNLFGKRENQTIDEALASVRTPLMKTKKKTTSDVEEMSKYTGTSALVTVKDDESAWQRVSARFREAPIIKSILNAAKQAAQTETGKKVQQKTKQVKDKLSDAQEEVLEVWETSQNPWVYRLSSIYDGLFGETAMGVAIKEIRRAEPSFILEEWKENIEKIVLPGVLEAFLRGNSRDLKNWFGEAAYSRVNTAIRERKSEGLIMDPHVLSIDHVEVIEATAEDKQAPIILMRFQAQQINCIRNREGDIVEGSEDEVLAYYYIFAFQRNYDEEQETLRWKIVDLHMQRGGRYY
ncbi:Mitochondrial import inner membrane translocase, subunit TIM44 [Plasmopara halstedii]|uniref:Mitochondrial import inner membrane translocase, subunit TIM44 n=1 Tax=Plasmopara halstedii TaxID=4781 RepID=A0A0P1B5A1_PLAHL|nr:Mitochondrial import inner membrane translocase, subunit TIM44 [Plasmopara halstedii]CEG49365.1 Mitochondrial import inner membrane translocase, subunit TIM44 [Plasmopara halstedii]|eukprot:XP_024585734.1 Mitochondrial import inner membrane translocase, subunit TIM44 [Plasmopara halstedii]